MRESTSYLLRGHRSGCLCLLLVVWMLSPWARSCRARGELVVFLLSGLLHLDLLLPGYFRRWRDFGGETMEDYFGLFEVSTSV